MRTPLALAGFVVSLACGGVVRPPAGPAVSARLTLAETPQAGVVLDEGRAVFLVGGVLVGVEPGAQAWTRRGTWDDTLVRGPGNTVLGTDGSTLRLLDARTGDIVSMLEFPEPHFDDTDAPEWIPPHIQSGVEVGGVFWLVDQEARFWVVDTAAGTVSVRFQLPDEAVDESRLLYDAASDTFVFEEWGQVRRLTLTGETRWTAFSHDALGLDGSVVLPGSEVFTLVDDERTVLTDACTGDFAPSHWPHPGELYSKEDDEVPGMGRGAPGCVGSRAYDEYVDAVPPLVLGTSIVINSDATRRIDGGSVTWTTEVGGIGTPVAGPDGSVLVASGGLDDFDPWTVVSLDAATGAPRWATPVGTGSSPFLVSADEVLLAATGDHLLFGYSTELVWVPLQR
ncbi:MAG: PQQ-binding-like beta-propeller repeat protein [Myxococcota bacterium]